MDALLETVLMLLFNETLSLLPPFLLIGVYLAKDAATSMGYYAQSGRSAWQRSQTGPTNCMALAEVVNLPSKFVSSNPHYVIKDTHWIMW